MGKTLIQQKRGKGSPTYRSPGHRYLGNIRYEGSMGNGIITDIIDAPGRTTPLAYVSFGKEKKYVIASKGMKVGDTFESIKKLRELPEGSKIYNVEACPGDGGKFCRSSGTFAVLLSSGQKKSIILLPSRAKKIVSSDCLATLGTVAAAGRKEKPLRKAGLMYHKKRSLGKLYPRTSGVAMNAVNHPFGGSAKPGKHKTVSRHASPGRKVGSISPRRTGKRKR